MKKRNAFTVILYVFLLSAFLSGCTAKNVSAEKDNTAGQEASAEKNIIAEQEAAAETDAALGKEAAAGTDAAVEADSAAEADAVTEKETAAEAKPASEEDTIALPIPFFKMDWHEPDEWKGELYNLRLLSGDCFEYKKVNAKYGIDPDFLPDQEGLDTLNISGSAQFSGPQFYKLAETLRDCAEGRTIYIFDLRQESHVFVNEGMPLSWYDTHNWANAGMTLEEIEKDESERFGAMAGRTVRAYARDEDTPVEKTVTEEITIQSFMTEKELVEAEGLEYFRIPVQDHTWPTAEEIDIFVDFVKGIDPEQVWLHFHCAEGTGRTGIFMMIYDMMKNPGLPMEDIVVRQTMSGASYPLYTGDPDNFKAPLHEEKARMMPLFYEYVQEQQAGNYAVSWSRWLSER